MAHVEAGAKYARVSHRRQCPIRVDNGAQRTEHVLIAR